MWDLGDLRGRNQIPTSSLFGFLDQTQEQPTYAPSAGSTWREEWNLHVMDGPVLTVSLELAKPLPLPLTPQWCPPRGWCQTPLATLPQVS